MVVYVIELAGYDEDATVTNRYGGRIPAAIVHNRLRSPCIGNWIVNTGLINAIAVCQMTSDNEQFASWLKTMAGAEEIHVIA
jgi:hypothetical protein